MSTSSTTDEIIFSSSLLCLTLLLPLPLSALLLLLVWQRQVANFLPFDLQQFPFSKETVQTHTLPLAHTQRRSLGCPGWTGAEVLQKGPGGKWRSFNPGTRVILAVPNLTGWMIIPTVPTPQWICTSERKRDIQASMQPCLPQNCLKTKRNQWADQWHTPWEHSSKKTMCSFCHFKQFASSTFFTESQLQRDERWTEETQNDHGEI